MKAKLLYWLLIQDNLCLKWCCLKFTNSSYLKWVGWGWKILGLNINPSLFQPRPSFYFFSIVKMTALETNSISSCVMSIYSLLRWLVFLCHLNFNELWDRFPHKITRWKSNTGGRLALQPRCHAPEDLRRVLNTRRRTVCHDVLPWLVLTGLRHPWLFLWRGVTLVLAGGSCFRV